MIAKAFVRADQTFAIMEATVTRPGRHDPII